MVNGAKIRRDSSGSPKGEVGEIDTRSPIRSVKAALSLFDDSISSPKSEVGEIDTSPPIQSVRAAVSLFGDTVSSPSAKQTSSKKSKSQLNVILDKEAEFHSAQKELGRYKTEVKNAEIEANKALPELENAMNTLMDLKDEIKSVNASTESITEGKKALKIKVKELEETKSSKQDRKGEYGNEDEYKAAAANLDAAKQELRRLRGDFDAAMNVKSSVLQMAEEAEIAAKEHSVKVIHLSKEIESMKESLEQLRLSTRAALEEQARVSAEKDEQERARRNAKEDVERKLNALLQEKEKEGLNGSEALEAKLAETNEEIEDLEAKIGQAKEALSESERSAYSELNAAKEALKEIERENRLLEEQVEALRLELADVGKEIAEEKEKEGREQSLEGRLQGELQEREVELESLLASKGKEADASSEMTAKLEKLFLEAKQANEEEREMRRSVEEMIKGEEVESAKEMEKRLEMAVKEAEEAKDAERKAQNELKIVSEKKDVAHGDQKKELSKGEYEALKEKASDPEKVAEAKVASAMKELEALRVSKNVAEEELKKRDKEIEELDKETEEVFKQAEMADGTKSRMEKELRR